MKKIFIVSLILLISVTGNKSFAQRGKDGAKTISTSVNVNEYSSLLADVSTGSVTLAVTNSTLNGSGYFSGPLAPGDLVFIIQMQGASMGLNNDSTYGVINFYNNCGFNEFAQVSTVPNSTTITLDCGLQHSYTASGRVQVVRVPRWSTLTINSGGQLTCPAWSGNTGGVVAVEVLGNTVINSGGSIYATGKGFRGGALDNQSQFGTLDYRWNTGLSGAEKGEGIAGNQIDYDSFSGRYDRGAPANGGGGGNGHTSGGGGGGNAGNIATWNGYGVPDVSTGSWANAWNLEWSGFAANNSSGGGRGGYSYSNDDRNALTEGPGNTNWTGDFRRNVGGVGGRPLNYSNGRLFLAGGGGAGDQNQNKGGAGGNGGGMIYILSFADVTGSGTIVSNGNNGGSTPVRGTDAAGGAGAGGTIVVNSTGTISGISISANGGNGGFQIIRNVFEPTEAEGPGGGGGGGYIAITNGAPARIANGGNNGTTDSGGLLEFPPNGATKGGTGLPSQAFASFYLTAIGDTICPNNTATLTAALVGTPPTGVSYYWYSSASGGSSIGSGTTFTTPVISSTTTYYAEICPGFYRVAVVAFVSPGPSTSFTYTTACLGDATVFTNTTSGGVSYAWDFGDGNFSGQANPNHTYATTGSFIVLLTATDNQGCQANITHTVTVGNTPQVSFTSTGATTGCGSLTVNFVNNTTGGGGNAYTWNFGDGSGTSAAINPSHTYSTPGTYTVTLAAILGSCSDADSIVNYITVNATPTANFTATNVCLGDVMNFTNSSVGATSYTWNFGDGTGTSVSTSPSYTYLTANTFTVTLIASNGTCTDTITQNVVVNSAPQVSFTSSGATTGCGSLTVNFVNNTTGGGGNAYTWNFGDGSGTSAAINPSHTYSTPGTYTVTLAAILGSCSDADSIVNYITVNAAPTANFSATNVCLGDVMNFTNSSSGATGYIWDFGDATGTSSSTNPTHTYATANTFTVTLIASDGTCNDTITQNVVVNNAPQVSFTSTGATTACGSLTVNFVNNTTGGGGNSYSWDFGDGTGTSSLQNPIYTYTTPGTYTVTLSATIGSCTDVDSLVNYITVTPGPAASFTAGSVCLGETVYFVNTSTGATNYLWDFGDGTGTSSLLNPTHVYTSGNTFTITLISYDGNCADTTTQSVAVNPAPVVLFSANATSACDSLTVTFTNNTTGAASYDWDFGDGFFSTDVNPTHTYNVPGVYSVTLNGIVGICISSQTSVNMISIYETPHAIVNATQTALCPNDCVNFTSVTTGSPSIWTWNFPGAATSISSSPNPQNICYNLAGSFNVQLSVSNGNCSSLQVLNNYIVVNPCTSLVAGFFSNDTLLCKGSCINFTSISQGASSYLWSFPGATPSTSTQPNPNNICYPASGSYDVTLIVSDGNSFDTLTVTNFIQVAQPPVPPTFSQNGDTLTSSAATAYQWFYGSFQISGATNQTYVAQASGNYYVMTTDINGCQASSQPAWVSLIGIDEIGSDIFVNLFPNPVSSQLTLLMESNHRLNVHIEVFDAIGKKIFTDEFVFMSSPMKKEIDFSAIAPGVYFISIETKESRLIKKVVKQ